jgi:hypothetical protein
MRFRFSRYVPLLAASGLALLAGLLSHTLFLPILIAEMGILLAFLPGAGLYILAAALFILDIILMIRGGIRHFRYKRQLPPPPTSNYNSLSEAQQKEPANILAQLRYYQHMRPSLRNEITEAVHYLEAAGDKQARIVELQRLNPRSNLDQAIVTIGNAQAAVAANRTGIITKLAVWEPADARNPGKAEVYTMNRRYIHENLDRSRNVLDQTDMLLHTVVRYVDSTQSGSDAQATSQLDSLNQALASLLQEYDRFKG